MKEDNFNISMDLVHAFGSTCSFNYQDAITICEEDNEEPKVIYPAGKTIAKKYIERPQMDFITFQSSAQAIECIHVLPTKTHVAVSQKPFGSNLRVVRIYKIKQNQKPQTIKIFNERENFGIIKSIVFSYSQPQFMCCLIGQPHNKLIYIDVSKNKPLAQSNFLVKQVQKISINPKNSHLICATGGSFIKLFKIEQYAFKPLQDIKKLPKNCKYLNHVWYRNKMILIVTDKCQVLVVEELKTGFYEVKQEYKNALNEPNPEKVIITSICSFSKGFILGSNNGKFSLWIRKQQGVSYDDQKLSLVRKWSTTTQRASRVTGIAISSKEDILAISLANNDIATIFLNQLLPQITDIDLEKDKKEVFFQYLHKGYHNNPVTGMDVCLQRPLLATCSQEDSTIRIWNYKNFGCKLLRMFYFRLKEQQSKPLITLSFHPNGYYLAVGCADKLRFFYVLSNQLRPYREVSIKNAEFVKFSHGGHMIAISSKIKQETSDQQIHILNAITLQEIACLQGHPSQIKSLEWKHNDQSICSISDSPGILLEWRISDWKQIRKIKRNDCTYQVCKYFCFDAKESIVIFARKENGKNYLHRFSWDADHNPQGALNSNKKSSQILDQYEIDVKVSSMNQITINQKAVLILGLDNGTILIVSLENGLKSLNIHTQHMKSVTSISISPCNRFVMTTGQDCMIFVYRSHLLLDGIIMQDDRDVNVVDDFLADVVLFHKKQITKYTEKQKQFSKVLSSLERRLEIISGEAEKKHNQKVQQLQIQKNRVIEDLNYRINRIQEQIQAIKLKNSEALQDLDAKNFNQVENLQKKYEEKIQFEKQKYFQLEQEIIQQNILHKKKLEELEEEKQKQVEKITVQFRGKFKQSEKIYTKSKNAVAQTDNIFDQKIRNIQDQQEEELRQLQERLQHFKTEKVAAEEQLHQKITRVRKQHINCIRERDQMKKNIEQLTYNRKKLDKELEQAKQKLKDMKIEYGEKIDILKNKEKKISDFEKKVHDLQKKKHILSYKATEMKKALEPKQMQIQKLKIDLMKLKKQFESSLERKQKQVLFMEKIQKERQQLQKQVAQHTNQVNKCTNCLDQIIYDIYTCIEQNKNNPSQNSKTYLKQVVKLYHKHVEKLEKKQEQNLDSKGVQDMTKQIVHLEKSLFQMNQSNQKNMIRKNDQINKRIKQNTELISTLNALKKDNQQFNRKIKFKTIEIDKLKATRTELLTELKKVDEQLYNRSQQQDDISIGESFKGNALTDKKNNFNNKFMMLQSINTTGNREKNLQIMSSLKKKENQLISQLDFLKQKIHKADFLIKQMRDQVKKHNIYYKCEEKVTLQQDLSQIN